MARIVRIQRKIDKGKGKAGNILGQTFNVYRLNPRSTGQLVQPSNLIKTNVLMLVRRSEKKADTEINMVIKVPMFEGLVDISKFEIGDVFVNVPNSFRYDGSVFTLADFRPLRAYVFLFTPVAMTLTRSENNPAGIDNGLTPYAGMDKEFEQNLVLNNGLYSFSNTGTPTTVYAGLQPTIKYGDMPPSDQRLATDVPRQHFDVYHANLPGVQLFESDIVNAAMGDRYFIRTPFFQFSGLQGTFLQCMKIRV